MARKIVRMNKGERWQKKKKKKTGREDGRGMAEEEVVGKADWKGIGSKQTMK